MKKRRIDNSLNYTVLLDYGDSETCFSEIADCLQCVIDNISPDKVDEIKEILMKLKSEVEW